MRSCRVMDGREWSKVPRSETPCADEITAWPRPESYLACKDGYTAGAVLTCQMGCHSIACKEISTRWRRVASTMDEVCGPWAGALPRPKMRYKCEMAYESSFRAGCEYGTDLLARTLARVAEKAAQEEQKEVIPEVEQVVDDEEPEAAVAEAATPVPPPVAEAEQVVEEEEVRALALRHCLHCCWCWVGVCVDTRCFSHCACLRAARPLISKKMARRRHQLLVSQTQWRRSQKVTRLWNNRTARTRKTQRRHQHQHPHRSSLMTAFPPATL